MMTPATSTGKKGLVLQAGNLVGLKYVAALAVTGNRNSIHTAAKPTPYIAPRNSLKAVSLHEASLHQKDVNKSELYEYNMGVLLLERKELVAKHEELKRSLVELEEEMRREQAAHLIAISESQKHEESLRKALGIEKECVADLEKALHEVRSEHAEIKVSAEDEVSKAHQLVASMETKSLTVESKLHAAEALQAEASRKQADTIRNLHEVQALESALQREKQFFQSEREIREAQIADDKETLRAWENRLQEGQDKLLEGWSLVKYKEESLLKKEDMLRKTEKKLEDKCRRNEEQQAVLKKKEHDYNTRMVSLAIQEKKIVKKELYLGKKEQELIILREILTSKGSEEIQKLIDEQKTALESRKLEFESELECNKKLVEEELGKRRYAMDVLEIEANHKEENMKRREQLLEKKDEKIKEKEKDVDLRLNAVKEKEKCNKNVEKEIENVKKILEREREDLAKSKEKLELMENSLIEQRQKVQTDTESLKVTEKERSELEKLQSNYIEEIAGCRIMKKQVEKETSELEKLQSNYIEEIVECKIMKKQVENEAEELKLGREKFEKEWELLDERREILTNAMEQVDAEKKRVWKWISEEEERLKSQEESFHVKMQNASTGSFSWISQGTLWLFNHVDPGNVIDSVEQRTDQEMPNPISSEVHEGNQHVDNTSTENIMKDCCKNCNFSGEDNFRNELRQDENKKVQEAGKSILTVNFEQPQPSSSRGDSCKPNDRSKAKIFRRKRSIKAVVEDAKANLETSSDNQDTIPADNQQIEGALREMPQITKKNDESETQSFLGDKLPSHAGKKRRRFQATFDQSVEDAEVESGNTVGGCKKRK